MLCGIGNRNGLVDAMSEDFENKNVGLVAGVIGGGVLVLGLIGLVLGLS